jgi:hypothetical protein
VFTIEESRAVTSGSSKRVIDAGHLVAGQHEQRDPEHSVVSDVL